MSLLSHLKRNVPFVYEIMNGNKEGDSIQHYTCRSAQAAWTAH
jgi:hypothetical protein